MFAAYDALPETEKAALEDLSIVHTVEAALRPVWGHPPPERLERRRGMSNPMQHPPVWTHSDGRKSLLLGTRADGVVSMKAAPGRALLWRLLQWAAQPDFVYRHEWHQSDMVVWNNGGLMHRVEPYADSHRAMHRTSIAGREKSGHVAAPEAVTRTMEPV